MRIDKYLSNLKYGSRTEIEKDIKNGLVRINNKVISSGKHKINVLEDLVHYNDLVVPYIENINLMLNKPLGYLSANKDNMHPVVLDLLKEEYYRYNFKIAGRLDLNSEGLLILTTNSKLVHKLTSPNSKIDKVYLAVTDIEANNYLKLLEGVLIKDGNNNDYLARALKIKKIKSKTYEITINEGKYHQVRRMFLSLGSNVISLKRIKYGKLDLGNLILGETKEFKIEDII